MKIMIRYIINYTSRISIFFVIISMFSSCEKNKKELYFENGNIQYEYETVKGLRHGKFVEYYNSGAVKNVRNYNYDTLHGLFIEFYEKGDTSNSHYYYKGVLTDTSFFYNTDHTLREIQIHDSLGRLIDYTKYDHGVKKTSIESKKVFLINKDNVLYKKDAKKLFIKLGNRDYDSVSYNLGIIDGKAFRITNTLPNASRNIGYLEISDSIMGNYKVRGFAIEYKKDSAVNFVPFVVDFEINH